MLETEIQKKIETMELNYPVEDLEIDDIYFWPILKMAINTENIDVLFNNKSSGGTSSKERLKKIVAIIKSLGSSIFKDFSKNDFSMSGDVVLAFSSVTRKTKLNNGTFLDNTVEPLRIELEKTGLKTFVIEQTPFNKFITPRFSKTFYLSFVPIFSMFVRICSKNVTKLDEKTALILEDLKKYCAQNNLSYKSLETSNIIHLANYLSSTGKVFSFIFKKIKPKYLIQSCWYGIENVAMILAAKKCGILTVDYQHGVQSYYHIAYGRWNKPDGKGKSIFPDIFWVWSKEDKENIDNWKFKSKRTCYVVGNAFYNLIQQNKIEIFQSDLIEEKIKKMANGKPICIVSLQPMYFLLPQILEQLKKISKKYFFLIRLHPSINEGRPSLETKIKEILSEKDYDFDLATTSPLPVVLKISNLHITYNSTVAFEASLLKIPSIVIDEDMGPGMFGHLDSVVFGVQENPMQKEYREGPSSEEEKKELQKCFQIN